MNGRLVGVLRKESSAAIGFQYDETWLGWEHAMPVSLSLPLREQRYIGEPVAAVFENLLPDTPDVRRRMAERVGAAGIDAYSLLLETGRDCVGALQILPDDRVPDAPGTVRGQPLTDDDIRRIVGNLANAPLGLGEAEDFRISIAGAQEKTALLRWNNAWFRPSGSTATTHILKPQIGRLANGLDLSRSVENEYLCLKLLHALGLPTAAAEMKNFGDHKILVVERFDRRWTRDGRLLRLPQEDLCQALAVPPSLKYDADGGPGIPRSLELLAGSDEPGRDQLHFLQAVLAFWLLAATDGHAKNFSVFLRPGGRFELTPLYDVISAQPSFHAGQIRRNQMKLAMAVGANRHYAIHEILPRHFVQTAARAKVGETVVRDAIEQLSSVAERALDETLGQLPIGFPRDIAESIAIGLRERLATVQRSSAARV